MQDYLVSICLPTYNRPVTLERTLNSLVNQTYTKLEIIVSDNCSSNPDVKSVIDKFKHDTRIKYFKQEVNKGPIFNFNFVLEKVTGDFFMKIADDDWIDTNYVKSCLSFLLENPDYSAAYGSAKIFKITGDFDSNDVQIDMPDEYYGKRVRKFLSNVKFNGTYYAIMRKECLLHVFSKNILAMDWIIISRITFIGKFKLIDTTHTNISLGGDSSSIANIINTYGMSDFTKEHPYLSICWNLFFDIIFRSSIYRKINPIKRFRLAKECFRIIYNRFKLEIIKELDTSTSKSLLINKWILSNIIQIKIEKVL